MMKSYNVIESNIRTLSFLSPIILSTSLYHSLRISFDPLCQPLHKLSLHLSLLIFRTRLHRNSKAVIIRDIRLFLKVMTILTTTRAKLPEQINPQYEF